jgi:dipeptidyl-peptidase 4
MHRLCWVIVFLALGAGARELPVLPAKPPAVYLASLRVHWFSDSGFWYRADGESGRRRFVVMDATSGKKASAFDHQEIARQLEKLIGQPVSPERLPIDSLRFVDDSEPVHLIGKKRSWKLDQQSGSLSELKSETSRAPSRRSGSSRTSRNSPKGRMTSPDRRWEAFVREHQLWLRDLESKKEQRLTDSGTEEDSFGHDVTRERSIGMQYRRETMELQIPDVYWSPDSKRLIAIRTKRVDERRVHYVETSPKGQLQPRLQSYSYLKPGDPVPTRTVHLFDVDAAKQVPVDGKLLENPWRLDRFRWQDDSKRFTFRYNARGHQTLRILSIDAETGKVTAMVEEQSATFVDYAYKTYLHFLESDKGLVWMSERDGWNHLYHFDTDGDLVRQITKGNWMVRRVTRIDEQKQQIWFDALGVRPSQDPYFAHHCRINFDGSGFVILTEGDGTHTVRFSPSREYFVDTWSRVDQPPVHELRRSDDGKLIGEIERADVSAWLKSGYRFPERFVAKGRDGETAIHGVIHLPRDFDPKKKYPVIENIYAGPHGAFAPKEFRHDYTHRREILESGFVIVQMDGMGTNWRGKKFHDVCWKNIGDAGFPDRIAWIRAAAKTRPFMDLTRVGIYGGSAGGQNAMRALIAHSDFYHVAVADCGCHDNRMDKIWWNEAWMGWPLGKHYEESSNLVQAHRLEGDLLLMLGGEDRNVDPASTLQVVDALVAAGKDFEFVLQPSAGHGSAETRYGRQRRLDFLQRKLLPRE